MYFLGGGGGKFGRGVKYVRGKFGEPGGKGRLSLRSG